jgi:hypothetical protein
LKEVAERLGKSPRWLQQRLAEDARRSPSQQRLQLHHYIGASKRWTEAAYLMLRDAIIAVDTEKRLGKPRLQTMTGLQGVGRHSAAAIQKAMEEVLNWPTDLNPNAKRAKTMPKGRQKRP